MGMKLGFVSAIVPELPLEEVLSLAKRLGYDCVEVMCWPPGKAERRYAGVTHIDVTALDAAGATRIKELVASSGVSISALGYYPNPLAADPAERQVYAAHIRAVIDAAELLGLGNVNTFIGRDPAKSIDDNWPLFLEVWPPLVRHAAERGIKIGIENCPMLFTEDEWPGGKNLATQPCDLAADVRGDPRRRLRPQLRPLAPDLAADGRGGARLPSSPPASTTSTPRTCGWTARA